MGRQNYFAVWEIIRFPKAWDFNMLTLKIYVINKVYLIINFQQIKFKAILNLAVMYNVSL